jgi:energy-coupling factor transport system permease protein
VTNPLSLYIPGNSQLHSLNPLTKLILTFSLIVFGFTIPSYWSSYVITFLVVVPLSLIAGVWKTLLRITFQIVWPFALSIFLIQGFLWGSGEYFIIIGPLSLWKDGLLFSIESVGNILLFTISFLLLSLTTRPDNLMLALSQIGIPKSITYVVVTAIQIAPYFQLRASKIQDAQQSRGLQTEGNIYIRARALIPMILPLVLSSLVDVEERSIAIEARAFQSPTRKTSLYAIPDTRGQRIFRWLLLASILLVIVSRIWLW